MNNDIYELMIFTFVIIIMSVWVYEDIKYREISSWQSMIVLAAMVLRSVFGYEESGSEVVLKLLIGLALFAGLLMISFLTKNGIGYADIILTMIMYFYLDTVGFVTAETIAVMLSFISVIVIFLAGKMNKKTSLPFIPYLYLGFAWGGMMR